MYYCNVLLIFLIILGSVSFSKDREAACIVMAIIRPASTIPTIAIKMDKGCANFFKLKTVSSTSVSSGPVMKTERVAY